MWAILAIYIQVTENSKGDGIMLCYRDCLAGRLAEECLSLSIAGSEESSCLAHRRHREIESAIEHGEHRGGLLQLSLW